MADNSDLARSLYEGWNERNFDQLAEAIAPDGEIVAVGTDDVFIGPEGWRRYNAMWADGFPDGRITINNIIAAGDSVVIEFTGRGTHTGTLVTSMGSISATGRPRHPQAVRRSRVQGRFGEVSAQLLRQRFLDGAARSRRRLGHHAVAISGGRQPARSNRPALLTGRELVGRARSQAGVS